MWAWILEHQVLSTVIIGLVVTNAINAMPTPRDGSSQFYEWFFKFANGLGGGIARLLAVYSPSTLTALTGQTVKPTIPPNPPVAEGEQPKPQGGK
jgi:hypothetical protein